MRKKLPIRLSLIVPVYNRPEEIKELLESLVHQTNNDFEIVIVEDGSTVSSEPIVNQYQDQLHLKYFYKDNQGPSIGRNYGIERATGNYFIFVDSDCILPPAYIEQVKAALESDFVDAFGGPDAAREDFSDLQKAISYAMTATLTTGGIRGKKKRVDRFYPRSFNMGISKAVVERLGGFPVVRLHPGEDMIFSIQILEAGFKTRLLPDAVVYHKRRTSLKKFYQQVYKFGFVRVIISALYPQTFKWFYAAPSVFLLGHLGLLAAASFVPLLLAIPLLYASLVFVDAYGQNKSLAVAALAILTSYTQLFGYGMGFLRGYAQGLSRDNARTRDYLKRPV
ncbi:MAG: glycosyltransferase [Bernardetiaceae bacterium]